jgi:hypothetical protein
MAILDFILTTDANESLIIWLSKLYVATYESKSLAFIPLKSLNTLSYTSKLSELIQLTPIDAKLRNRLSVACLLTAHSLISTNEY